MTQDKESLGKEEASFNRVYDEVQKAEEHLSTEEFSMFRHWLSVCDIAGATYELQRARFLQKRQQHMPAELHQALVTQKITLREVEKQLRLPIEDICDRWDALIKEFGGEQEARSILMQLQLFNRYIS